MYSSGKDLHLDLLGHNINGTVGKHWEIPPYEMKAVMKATFYSKDEGIANRFVRVKLGAPASSADVVIIPFEMIVSNSKIFNSRQFYLLQKNIATLFVHFSNNSSDLSRQTRNIASLEYVVRCPMLVFTG